METVVYILVIAIMVLAAVLSVLTFKKDGFTAEGYRKVRQIIYQAIDDAISLTQQHPRTLEELTALVTTMIYERVQEADIPQEDKNFWTKERIAAVVTPVLESLLEKTEEQPAET